MGQGLTELQNDVSVQLVSNADQLKSMQALNTAWDTWTGLISAPTTDILTLSQNISTFAVNAQKAGANMTGLASLVAGSTSAMKSSSVQLQQDFQTTFGSVQQLFDAFRSTQAVTGQGDFTSFVKDAVAALIPLAQGNKAATAEVSALAQEAGGPATTDLQALAKWAGNVKDPMDALYTAAQNATVATSNLSQDAAQLTTTLQQQLNPAMAQAVFNAHGGQKVFNDFATALVKTGPGSAATAAAAKNVAAELLAISGNSANAKAEFVGFAESMGMSATQADVLWAKASAGMSATSAASGKLRDSLAKSTAAGTDLAASGFWGQVRDKIMSLVSFAGKHPIATILFGALNFIPGFTAAMDKASAIITTFFTKTVPDAARGFGSALSGAWGTAYTSFTRGFGSPLTAWFTTSFPHALAATWDKAWSGLVTPVVKAFDSVKKTITGGFDGWWKTHGSEVEQVWHGVTSFIVRDWNTAWAGFSQIFSGLLSAWDGFTGGLETAWKNLIGWFTGPGDIGAALTGIFKTALAAIEPIVAAGIGAIEAVFKTGWALVTGVTKVAWDSISAIVTQVWDGLKAVVTVGIAGIEAILKTAWDLIVGIFSVALDLLTGHWSQAWKDIETTGEQIWNAISGFFKTAFSAFTTLATQTGNNISTAWSQTWNAIKSTAETIWNAIWAFLQGLWNTVKSAATAFGSAIENIFSTAWNAIENTAKSVWNSISSFFSSWWATEKAAFTTDVDAIGSALSAAWNAMENTAKTVWNAVSSFFSSVWSGLESGVSAAVSAIGSAWNGLVAVVEAPVNAVIDILNSLIGAFDSITSALGLGSPIPKIPALTVPGGTPAGGGGGGGSPTGGSPAGGGAAHGRKITQGTGPTADDVLIRVSRGETVVSAADSQTLAPAFAAVGVPGYAAGGIPNPISAIKKVVSAVGGVLPSAIWNSLKAIIPGLGAVSSLAGLITGATTDLAGIAGKGSGAKGVLGSILTAMPAAIVKDMLAWLTGHVKATAAPAGAGGKPGKNVIPSGVSNASAVAAITAVAAAHGWGPAEVAAWLKLESYEDASLSLTATNPSSGAYGLAQFINGPSEYAQYGGNATTYAGQATAMANYIAQRYGTPSAALAFETSHTPYWYAKGGLIKGYAAGGMIGTAQQIDAAQSKEVTDYNAAYSAVAASLAHIAKGSYLATAAHKTQVTQELGELASNQKYEVSAYNDLQGSGLTAKNLSWFRSQLGDVLGTAQDAEIGHVQGARMNALAAELKIMESLAGGAVPSKPTPTGKSPAPTSSTTTPKMTAGQVAGKGAADLKAWEAHQGAGTVNTQIAHWQHQLHTDTTLAGAKGLTKALAAKYMKAETTDKKTLTTLNTELGIMRDYRTQLSASNSDLSSWISAADGTKSLAKYVTAWKKQQAAQQKTIDAISMMLGPTAETLAASAAAATAKNAAAAAAAAATAATAAAASSATSTSTSIDTGIAGSGGSTSTSTSTSTPAAPPPPPMSASQALSLLSGIGPQAAWAVCRGRPAPQRQPPRAGTTGTGAGWSISPGMLTGCFPAARPPACCQTSIPGHSLVCCPACRNSAPEPTASSPPCCPAAHSGSGCSPPAAGCCPTTRAG